MVSRDYRRYHDAPSENTKWTPFQNQNGVSADIRSNRHAKVAALRLPPPLHRGPGWAFVDGVAFGTPCSISQDAVHWVLGYEGHQSFAEGGEGEGVRNPKHCAPKKPQIHISFCKFHFSQQ